MINRRTYLLIWTPLTLMACATAPQTYDFDPVHTIEWSRDDVWAAVVQLAGARNWPIKVLETGAGYIGFDEISIEAAHVDCGSAPLATDVGLPIADINITLSGDDTSSTLRVNVRAEQERRVLDQSGIQECVSRGTIEDVIVGWIQEILEGRAASEKLAGDERVT